MGNLGGSEILVILLVALLVLGPDKLPDAARQAGKMMRQIRRMSVDFRQEFENAIDLESDDDLAIEKAARARGDELVMQERAEAEKAQKASPAINQIAAANAMAPTEDATTEHASTETDDPPAASPASMAYRPDQSPHMTVPTSPEEAELPADASPPDTNAAPEPATSPEELADAVHDSLVDDEPNEADPQAATE